MNLKDSYLHGTDLIALIRALKWDGGVLKYLSASTSTDWISVGTIPTWNQNTTGKAATAGTADKVKNSLTFTGGVTGTWDGSSAKTIAIPTKSSWNYDDRYLKLSGGTITNTNSEVPLSIIGKGGYSAIKFLNNLDPVKYRIFGINNTGDLFVTNQSGWSNEYTVYHSGNLSIKTLMGSTAIGDSDEPVYWNGNTFVKANAYPTKASWNYDDRYLKLTGGTMSNTNVVTNLNSDLLDGYHANSFAFVENTYGIIGNFVNGIGESNYIARGDLGLAGFDNSSITVELYEATSGNSYSSSPTKTINTSDSTYGVNFRKGTYAVMHSCAVGSKLKIIVKSSNGYIKSVGIYVATGGNNISFLSTVGSTTKTGSFDTWGSWHVFSCMNSNPTSVTLELNTTNVNCGVIIGGFRTYITNPSNLRFPGVSNSAESVAWTNITGKPSSYTPAEHNHNTLYPKKDGTGATGNWGINITGNAATATKASSIATEYGTNNVYRNVFFAYDGDKTKVVYDDNFMYNPSINTLKIGKGTLTETNYSGNAATATLADNANKLGNITASNYFKNRDAVFNSECSGKYLWTIWDNHLYAADKRFAVTLTGTNSTNFSPLFDGSFESSIVITDTQAVLHIKHTTAGNVWTTGLPYGSFYVVFYYSDAENVTGRVYCNYSPQGTGWHDLNVTHVRYGVWELDNRYYELSDLEITITKPSNVSYIYLCQVLHEVERSNSPYYTAVMSKYCNQKTDYNIEAAKFIGPLQGNASSATTSTYASNVGSSGTVGTNYVTASKVISACNWYDTMIGSDSDTVINRWSEIVSFVAGFKETPDLATFLSNNYLAKAGGTMTGQLKWADQNALPNNSNPQYFLCTDTFATGGITKYATKADTLKSLTGLTSTAIGDSDEPVYWDGSKFVKAGAYPTKASWNYDDRYAYSNVAYYYTNVGGFEQTAPFWFKFCTLPERSGGGELYTLIIEATNGSDAPQVTTIDLARSYSNSPDKGWNLVQKTSLFYYNGLGCVAQVTIDTSNNIWLYYDSTWKLNLRLKITILSTVSNITILTLNLAKATITTTAPSAAYGGNLVIKKVSTAIYSNRGIIDVPALYENGTRVSLEGHNHNSLYVTSLGTSGNYLTWTKNGTTNNITVPYATNAGGATESDYLTTRYIGSVGDTVAQVKLKILDSYTSLLGKQGYSIKVNSSFMLQYPNDDYVIPANGVYSLTYLTPGYNGKNYGLWLAACLGSMRLYVFGRENNLWTERKTIAWTSDIPTKVSQLTNDAGYVTTDTTYSIATADTLGLVKIGYTANGKNYPVQLSNGQMYVNVPWTDTNTTYNFSGTSFTSGNSSTGEHNANNITSNGHWYYTSNGPSTSIGASTNDGALYSQAYSDIWVAQIAQDYRNGRLFVRGKNNGTWLDWKRIAITGESQPANGGNADTATSAGKLTTARKVYTNLESSSNTSTFDWSGDTALPVYGTLPITNGGTGANDKTTARINLEVTQSVKIGDNSTSNTYRIFAKETKYSSIGGGWTGASFLIGGTGYPGSWGIGTYLVTLGSRGNVPHINVITLIPPTDNLLSKTIFGYYCSGEDVYYGVYCSSVAYPIRITEILNHGIHISMLTIQTTTLPTGWTTTTNCTSDTMAKLTSTVARAIADDSGNIITKTYLPLAGGTMTGTLIMSGISTSNWTEGIRINNAANGWTTLALGGTSNSGTSAAVWSLHTYQNNFYLANSGSSSFTNGIKCVDGIWSILSSGNVGIGTSSPSSKLHVVGDIYTTTGFKKKDSSDSYVLLGGGGHKLESNLSVNYATSAGNANTLDNKHASDFVQRINGTGSIVHYIKSLYNWNGILITIPLTWSPTLYGMFAFTIRLYHSYKYTDIVISGYNYGTNHWHLPKAEIIGGIDANYKVKFGWFDTDTNKKLWVWIGRSNNTVFSYGGLSIMNVHCGFYDANMYEGWESANVSESELTNVQHSINTLYLPVKSNGDITGNAATATNVAWSGVTNKPNFVNSFGTKTGDITIRGGQTSNGSVNLVMSNNELLASIVGLGSNAYTSTAYLSLAGGQMTGLITTTSAHSHDGIRVGDTYINAINGNLIFLNNSSIRFGGDSWNYDVWAGLKYVHSSKIIYLGLADGSAFAANSAQSGGKLYLPGIDNLYTGNGTNLIWHAGNDGSGSGLDADLLDGKHASAFATSDHNHNSTYVAIAGNQTIAGNKTFSGTTSLSIAEIDSLTTGNLVNQGSASLGTITSGIWNASIIAADYLPLGGTDSGTKRWVKKDATTGLLYIDLRNDIQTLPTGNKAYLTYIGALSSSNNNKSNAATTNGNTYMKIFEDNILKNQYKISGSGSVSVTSDANGNITITGTTYTNNVSTPNEAIAFAAANYNLSSASWTSATSLTSYSGTFAIQIKDTNSTTNKTNYYSGIIMLNGSTGRLAVEEIPLSALMATGSDTEVPTRIYAGIQQGVLKLSSQDASAVAHNITVKILKLIAL